MLTRFYARVSSGRQENEETIQSQVAELCAKVVVEEKSGVEVIFLKGAVEDTPEGMLLLHL